MLNQATKILNEKFGFNAFRQQQEDIIAAALAGEDIVVLMPTGGGKSLCFQIPALVREGMGIVVSPLIALMQDQVSALQQNGIRAYYLNSTLSEAQYQTLNTALQQRQVDMLYIAPERLLMESTLQRLSQHKISLIAIDEAHCISQWGHDFRKDYLGLNKLKTIFKNVPRMALTATADERTRHDIATRLELDNPNVFVSSFDRPNIRYSVKPKNDAKVQLMAFLQRHKDNAGIIYCMSRKKVDATSSWLQEKGINALPYHAGLDKHIRAEHLHRFLYEEGIVMVATIAFGMGIDKPDVRFVFHLDLPKNIEALYQETGRAGRDGLPSESMVLYGLQDVMQQTKMIDDSQADIAIKQIERRKIDALLGWCETTGCRRQALLHYFDESSADQCNNCDTCLTPPDTWDATLSARKLLSNIYRTGQRFGVNHVLDVLEGKDTIKVRQHQHQDLSTYGIGKDMHRNQWRSILRQLIVRGYVRVSIDEYGALQLTDKCKPLLKNETQLFLRQEPLPNIGIEKKKRQASSNLPEHEQPLWQALRQCRKKLADAQGVPPFHVFNDATLIEMVHFKPQDAHAFLAITGVGEIKLERYGDEFMDIIAPFVHG